jgi:hypothetical protein
MQVPLSCAPSATAIFMASTPWYTVVVWTLEVTPEFTDWEPVHADKPPLSKSSLNIDVCAFTRNGGKIDKIKMEIVSTKAIFLFFILFPKCETACLVVDVISPPVKIFTAC